MLRNIGLSLRLNIIVIGINFLLLVIVATIASSSADGALRQQAITRFEGKNAEAATALNATLSEFATIGETIAANVTTMDDLSNSDILRRLVLDQVPVSDDLIQQVSIWRPDDSLAVLQLDTTATTQEYQWRIFRQEVNDFRNEFLEQSRREQAPIWFIQRAAAFSENEGTPVISLALPYQHEQGDNILWLDMRIQDFEQVVSAALNNEGLLAETSTGYVLLVAEDGTPLTAFNLPTRDNDVVAGSSLVLLGDIEGEIASLLGDLSMPARRESGFALIEDPINGGNEGLFSQLRFPINNWRFISVLPVDEIPIVPVNVVLPIVVIGLAGIGLLTILVNRFIRSAVVEPLNDMERSAAEIGLGNLQYHVQHREKGDEIGRLARSLEYMRIRLMESNDSLRQVNTSLERVNASLEERVIERTEQLAIAQQRAEKTALQLRAIYDESISVVNEQQLKPVLDTFIERLLMLLNATYCGIWLLNSDKTYLNLLATNDPRPRRDDSAVRILITEGIAGKAVRGQSSFIIDDYAAHRNRVDLSHYYEGEATFQRAMVAPLLFAGQSIGAVVVGRPADMPRFDGMDERELTLFTNLVAPSVRNAQLLVQLQEAIAEAERANDVKTRFLATVTHELRTPLNLIINNIDFMRVGMFGDVNEEQVERLSQTVRSAEHLLYLINDLLDVSKIEAGEMQLHIQENEVYTMLEDVVDNVVSVLESDEIKSSKVALRVEIEEQLPTIPMDVRRIKQVLTNLLSNAVKFTPEGTVTLKVFFAPNGIHFSVHDTGIGIPESEMDKLFKAFERTSLARGVEGTGLGLPISQFMVRAHNSELTVISELGAGSTFAFILPFEQKQLGLKMTDTQQITAVLSSRE